jgi:hypothetical protein
VQLVQVVAHRNTSVGTRLRLCFLPVRNAERNGYEGIDEEACAPSDYLTCRDNHGRGRNITGNVDRHQGRLRTSLLREATSSSHTILTTRGMRNETADLRLVSPFKRYTIAQMLHTAAVLSNFRSWTFAVLVLLLQTEDTTLESPLPFTPCAVGCRIRIERCGTLDKILVLIATAAHFGGLYV